MRLDMRRPEDRGFVDHHDVRVLLNGRGCGILMAADSFAGEVEEIMQPRPGQYTRDLITGCIMTHVRYGYVTILVDGVES